MKANNVSEKGMPDGKTYKVNVYEPTFSEWVKHFAQTGFGYDEERAKAADKELERFASDYNGHKVANNLASALKGAFKRVMDPEGKKTSESYVKAELLVERVKGGDVFDLREFVSAKKREAKDKRVPLVQFEQVKQAILGKWLTSDEAWRQAIIDKLELEVEMDATLDEAIAALEAKYCAPPQVDLESLL